MLSYSVEAELSKLKMEEVERLSKGSQVRKIFETENEGFFETWDGAITLLEWYMRHKHFWIIPRAVAPGLRKVGLLLYIFFYSYLRTKTFKVN